MGKRGRRSGGGGFRLGNIILGLVFIVVSLFLLYYYYGVI
jgi:hypothetical protein